MKAIRMIVFNVLLCLLLAGGFALYVTYGERSLLTVKEHAMTLRQSETPQTVRVVQFSDTHVGKYFSLEQLQKVVDKINEETPDFVIFSGDLFDLAAQVTNREAVFTVLQGIRAKIGKIAVFGNRDYGSGAVRFYEESMERAGFTVLVDETVQFPLNNGTFTIAGADDFIMGAPQPQNLMEQLDASHVNLFVVHEPDANLSYEEAPIDLALSGHSHGGQVILPFYGAVASTTYCETYFKGLYNLTNDRGTRLYVSSGIGNTKVPFRLGNMPEIVRFDLTV